MSGRWWSSQDAEAPSLEGEHIDTRGDHFGTVQTACPMCQAIARTIAERIPPVRICPACGVNEAAQGDRYCSGCGSAPDRSAWIDGPGGRAHV